MMPRALTVVAAAVCAVVSIAFAAVAVRTKADAHSSLERAQRLYAARLAVAEAQAELGNSDLADAVASARKANATAERVRVITTRMADLLASAEGTARSTTGASERAVRTVVLTRRQTVATSGVLAAISGYQRAASSFATDTNRALERILRALRKTNESFPGGRS